MEFITGEALWAELVRRRSLPLPQEVKAKEEEGKEMEEEGKASLARVQAGREGERSCRIKDTGG